jgi:hypothetical protein
MPLGDTINEYFGKNEFNKNDEDDFAGENFDFKTD